MKKRVITGLIMAAILIPALVIPQVLPFFELILIAFGIIASVEMLNMYDKQKKMPLPIKIVTVFLTIVLYFSIVNMSVFRTHCEKSLICQFLDLINLENILTPFVALAAIFIIVMAAMVFVADFDASDVGRIFLAIIYIGVSIASFTVLRYMGLRFAFYLLLITIATDIFALVFGLTMGKHKMAPAISPKKTWEGAIGGTAVALIIGFCFSYFYKDFAHVFHSEGDGVKYFFDNVFDYANFSGPGQVFFIILLTLAMSVCSQIGDLIASKLKRCYGIKDFSNIFPGHGGVLDRFDSTFFASAIFLMFIVVEANLFPIV